jgi:hypothetical protein
MGQRFFRLTHLRQTAFSRNPAKIVKEFSGRIRGSEVRVTL